MRKFLLLLSILVFIQSYSQDFYRVDSIATRYPHFYSSPDKLAALIKKDFKAPTDRARAIFTWMAKNVQFDVKEANNKVIFRYATEDEKRIKEKKYKDELIIKALRQNKTTNRGYAWLYDTLSKACGLECEIISGYLKSTPDDISQLPTTVNHIWNAVKIDNEWRFVDTTIAAGNVDENGQFKPVFNDGYFFTTPDLFFLNHYPSNEKWLFVQKNKQDFASLPLFYGDYVKANYKIVSPPTGHLSVADDNTVTFKFEGLDPSVQVAYFTDGKNQMEVMQQDETTLEHVAVVDKNSDRFISLFINEKLIATYKLI